MSQRVASSGLKITFTVKDIIGKYALNQSGETAQPVKYLLQEHKDQSLNSRIHVKFLGSWALECVLIMPALENP